MTTSFLELLKLDYFENIELRILKDFQTKSMVTRKVSKCFLIQSSYLAGRIKENPLTVGDSCANATTFQFVLEYLYGHKTSIKDKSSAAKLGIDLQHCLDIALAWNLHEFFRIVYDLLGGKEELNDKQKQCLAGSTGRSPFEALEDHVAMTLFNEIEEGVRKRKTAVNMAITARSGKKFYCHKEILYVRGMQWLRSRLPDCNRDKALHLVELQDLSLKLLLVYLYQGSLTVYLSELEAPEEQQHDFHVFASLYVWLSKHNKRDDWLSELTDLLKAKVSQKNALEIFLSRDNVVEADPKVKSIVVAQLLLVFGGSRDRLDEFILGTRRIRGTVIPTSTNVPSIGGEVQFLRLLRRAVYMQERRINRYLQRGRKTVAKDGAQLNEEGSKIDAKLESLRQTLMNFQIRMSNLGDISPQKKSVKALTARVAELEGKGGDNTEELAGLEDKISETEGAIFIFEKKAKRYREQLKSTKLWILFRWDIRSI